jgi:hypothetical protein
MAEDEVKKPRKRRVRASGEQPAKSTTQSPSSPLALPTPTQIQPTQPEPARSGKPRRELPIAWIWKEFWAYAGPILTMIGVWFILSPQISVEPSVNLDPSQPLATQFLVCNRGHVPVNHVSFDCAIGVGGGHIGELDMNSKFIQPIATMHAGLCVPRACAERSADIQTPRISIAIHYEWPIIGKRQSETFYFSIRKGVSSYFLVPDAPL